MKCENIHIGLPGLIDGTATGEEKKLLEDHIAACPECKKEYADLAGLFGKLHDDKPWTPPANYWNSLLPRIHERIDRRKAPAFDALAWIQRMAVSLAAVVLVMVGLKLVPANLPESGLDISTIVRQLPDDAIQTIADRQSIEGVEEPASSGNNGLISDDDKEILKDLITQEAGALDEKTAIDAVSHFDDQGQQNICAVLDHNY